MNYSLETAAQQQYDMQQPDYAGDYLISFTDSGVTIMQELDDLVLDMSLEA